MELKIPNLQELKCPGWSKTGRRTRSTTRPLPPSDHDQRPLPLTASDDDDGRDLSDLECGELATEDLPPKKRKLDSASSSSTKLIIDGNGIDIDIDRERKHHRCNICSRSFSSYQALGGHKAHHSSKDQKGEDDGGVLRTDDEAVAVCGEPPKGGGGGGGGGGGAVHRCTFCYKVFLNGQALGGHRRHCQRPAVSENRGKIFSFDLNELPPEWLGS